MKILSKAYFLIAILIIAAAVNLLLLYQDDQKEVSQSYSIIRIGEIKVKAESISSSSRSLAGGDLSEEKNLVNETENVEKIISILKNGGVYNGQTHERIPVQLLENFNQVEASWESYKEKVAIVKLTTRFDSEAIQASEYILDKNQEMILLTDQLVKDLNNLDRNFNEHKQIAKELVECVKIIGEQTLLIRTGEEFKSQETLNEKQLKFEIGLRKLLQIPTTDLDVESVGETHDTLEAIPRENSEALRQLDPLWESVSIRIDNLEERGILSKEYTNAIANQVDSKLDLFKHSDTLIEKWNELITSQDSEKQVIVQSLLIVDIAVFVIVLVIIRTSLSPLGSISKAISKVREGVYGEKIEYSGKDEVGELIENFNIMSSTIKEKEEEAKKTDIAKDEFLAMITHELKTPLVPIQGYSDILLSEHLGKLTDKQKERIEIIKSSSETLLSIISDLLDAQKLELGQLKMKKEKVNIKNTIDSAIQTFIPEASKDNIEIISNTFDCTVSHDPERIKQVITNLVKNSLTSVQPGSGKIEITLEENPSEVKVSVKDNGIGIPIDKQADLFKKFYQVDTTLTRERGGSGLGLAISKGIIDNHRGKISVQSTPNQGATFSLTLPKDENLDARSPA